MQGIKELISYYKKKIPGLKADLRDFEDPESGIIDKVLFVTNYCDSMSRKEVYAILDDAPNDMLARALSECSGFTSVIEKRTR